MTKFTPGPWKIHGKNIDGNILIGKKGEKDWSGKIVHVNWNCCGEASEEWKANALLISKAPEMYEALKTMEQTAIALSDAAPTDYKNERNDLFAAVHNAHLKVIELLKEIKE